MATARQASLILLFALASLPDSATYAGMVLLGASHWAVVGDIDGGDRENLDHTTPDVQFEGTVSASHRMLRAEGVFSAFVDTNLLTSSVESAHFVLQTIQKSRTELFSEVGSTFWFTTDMDVEVSVHGSMSSYLGVADSEIAMVLDIFDGNQNRIHRSVLGSSIGTGADMFLFGDSILLDGGGMYFVEVYSHLIAFAHRNPEPVSTATGEIALLISTVPEPTSLALLCCGALLATRFRRGTIGNRSVAG